MFCRLRVGLLVAALALIALPATASARAPGRDTVLVTRAFDGGFPNGATHDAVPGGDGRWTSLVAFDSDASNLVRGDTNGLTDVFVVHRARPYGDHGSPWHPGRNELVSTGRGGRPANGRSYAPSIDGYSEFGRPHCVAFVSDATNLVRGDTNGQPDAFVRNLRTHQTIRVSVDSRGRQANGRTTEVSIDGHCTRVAFTSRATNLAMTHTKVRQRKIAVTGRPRPGTSQVYVHVLPWGTGIDKPWRNATYLVSANDRRQPGNGDSYQPSLAAQKGRGLAFTSTSTNLARGDAGATPDVYLRVMIYDLTRWRTYLASRTGSGTAGNGASSNPSVSGDGLVVAYQTDASNLLPGDDNGHTDVGRADLSEHPSRPAQYWASHGERGGGSTAPAFDPTISYGGQFVLFTSASSNWETAADRADTNGVSDVFLWTVKRRRVFQMSVDSSGHELTLPSGDATQSAHGNYVFFATSAPFADRSLVGRAAGSPAFSQIYMRYVGAE